MSELFSFKDEEIGELIPDLRKEHKAHIAEIRNIPAIQWPMSGTPADLDALYTEHARAMSYLSRVSEIVRKWHRLYVEASALYNKRDRENTRDKYRFIIDPNNQTMLKPLRSEASKMTKAEDELDLPSTDALQYLSELSKGWYSQVSSSYSRLEKQTDAILTQVGILKTSLGLKSH